MQKVKHLLYFLFLPLALCAQSIKFDTSSNNWQEVLAKAQKLNKPIFVDVYTDWCGPCKWMDQNVFNAPSVAKFFDSNFLSVKIDGEKGYGPGFAQLNSINSYPTYLFFSPKGELVLTGLGSKPADVFIKSANNALENLKSGISLQDLEDKMKSGNLKPVFVEEYIKKLSVQRKPNGALIEYYLNVIPEDSLNTPNVISMITTGKISRMPVKGKIFQIFLNEYKKYPVKSGELMSAWNSIRNRLLEYIDSAGRQNDEIWLAEIMEANDYLNDNPVYVKRERNYFLCRYYAFAKDSAVFIKYAIQFANNYFLEIDKSEAMRADSIGFINALSVKFKKPLPKTDKEYVQFKRVYRYESVIAMNELTEILLLYKQKFPTSFKENLEEIKKWLTYSIDAYRENPVYGLDYEKTLIRNETYFLK